MNKKKVYTTKAKSSTTKTKTKTKKKTDSDMARAVANITSFIESFTIDGDDDDF